MTSAYVNRSLHYTALIKETSSYSILWLIKRATSGRYIERHTDLNVLSLSAAPASCAGESRWKRRQEKATSSLHNRTYTHMNAERLAPHERCTNQTRPKSTALRIADAHQVLQEGICRWHLLRKGKINFIQLSVTGYINHTLWQALLIAVTG